MTQTPDTKPVAGKVEKSPLLADADRWTVAQALGKLTAANSAAAGTQNEKFDDPTRVSAALRIVRLAKANTPLAAEPLPVATAKRLRVARVGEARWVLGVVEKPSRVLSSPVFIDAEGGVAPAADGADAAQARLYVSKDAEVVPHLLVLPQRVALVRDELEAALVGKKLFEAVFELRFRNEYPYVALVCRETLPLFEDPPEKDRSEAAIYRWDPDEPGFVGPAMDWLPDPCSARFELDLGESKALIPVGGEIPEPAEPKGPPGRPRKDKEVPIF